MQKAYASYQFTQLIGRFSCVLAVAVQVAKFHVGLHARFAFVGAT
jgi:hypothetical protein